MILDQKEIPRKESSGNLLKGLDAKHKSKQIMANSFESQQAGQRITLQKISTEIKSDRNLQEERTSQKKYEPILSSILKQVIIKEDKLSIISQRLNYDRIKVIYCGSFSQEINKSFYEFSDAILAKRQEIQQALEQAEWQWVNVFLVSKIVLSIQEQESILNKVKAIFYCTESEQVQIEANVSRFRSQQKLIHKGRQTISEIINYNNKMTVSIYPNISNIHTNANQANISRKNMCWILLQGNTQKYKELFLQILEHEKKYKWFDEQNYSVDDLKYDMESGRIEKYYLCIKRYTIQSFFYRIINRSVRSIYDCDFMPYFKYPIQLLYKQVRKLWKKQVKRGDFKDEKICYRKCYLTGQQKQDLLSSNGKYFQLQGFTSTTLIKEETEKFHGNSFLIIKLRQMSQISDEVDDLVGGFANICQFSQYGSQQQVLINPLNYFKVGKVFLDEEKTYVQLEMVQMMTDNSSASAMSALENEKQFKAYCRHVRSFSNDIYNQGSLFFQLGLFEKHFEYHMKNTEAIIKLISQEKFPNDQLLIFLTEWVQEIFSQKGSKLQKLIKLANSYTKQQHDPQIKILLIAILYQELSQKNIKAWVQKPNYNQIMDHKSIPYEIYLFQILLLIQEGLKMHPALKEILQKKLVEKCQKIKLYSQEIQDLHGKIHRFISSIENSQKVFPEGVKEQILAEFKNFKVQGYFSSNCWKPILLVNYLFLQTASPLHLDIYQTITKEHEKSIALWSKSQLYSFISPFFTDLKLFYKTNFSQQELKDKLEEQLDYLERLISSQKVCHLQNHIFQMFQIAYRLQKYERFEKTAERVIAKIHKTIQNQPSLNFTLTRLVALLYQKLRKLNQNRRMDKSQLYSQKRAQCLQKVSWFGHYEPEFTDEILQVSENAGLLQKQNNQKQLSIFQLIEQMGSEPETLINLTGLAKIIEADHGLELAGKGQMAQGLKEMEKSYAKTYPEDKLYLKIAKRLGFMYFKNGQFDKSIQLHQEYLKALQISFYPLDHLQVGIEHFRLGKAYSQTQRWVQAVQAYKVCLKIFISKTRCNPNFLMYSFIGIAKAYLKLNNYTQAKSYLQQIISWYLDQNIQKQLDCKKAYLSYIQNYFYCFSECLKMLLKLSKHMNSWQFLFKIMQKVFDSLSFHRNLIKKFQFFIAAPSLIAVKFFLRISVNNQALYDFQRENSDEFLFENQNQENLFNEAVFQKNNAKIILRGLYSLYVYFCYNQIQTSRWLKSKSGDLKNIKKILKQQSKIRGSRKKLSTLSSLLYSLLFEQTKRRKVKSKYIVRIKDKRVRQIFKKKINEQKKEMKIIQQMEKKEEKKKTKGKIVLIDSKAFGIQK